VKPDQKNISAIMYFLRESKIALDDHAYKGKADVDFGKEFMEEFVERVWALLKELGVNKPEL